MQKSFVKKMNQFGKERRPFLFILDFDLAQTKVLPLDEIAPSEILFDINGQSNFDPKQTQTKLPLWFEKQAIPFEQYQEAFEKVQAALRFGDSYLCNLTFASKVQSNWNLKAFFEESIAKYKLWLKDELVVFSPEIFVQIKDGIISSNPMKGTIDANLPNARQQLLDNFKEIAEHHTIVDLIRNDLNLVASKTKVEQFRYIDFLRTNGKDLLQASSKISAELAPNYPENLGTIFEKLLPAGSVTGAPKKRTVEIIKDAESSNRGFYTGIVGIFDGKNVDSGVLIRLIEKTENGLFFRSGGGITIHSKVKEEYQELIDKIYVPIARKYPNTKQSSPESLLSSNSNQSITKI